MPNLSNGIERQYCFECKRTCLHTTKYSNNKSKSKSICSLCNHTSYWVVSIYPYPKKDTDKQVDYIVKDVEDYLNNV